jgi:hypothetical protein
MDPLTLIILLIVGYFLYSGGVFSSLGFGPLGGMGGVAPPPSGIPSAPLPVDPTSQIGEQYAQTGVSNALGLVPVVGPALSQAFNAIVGSLKKASDLRRKQAISENVAVANAIPGWDSAMYQINKGYNNGSLTAGQVSQLVDLIWNNYWQEVGPVIQPGRNGCQSGSMSKQEADQRFPGILQCSDKSWGAACCVGYADLANGAASVKAAVATTDNTGKPTPAYIPSVSASKYGGVNRAAYTLTFTRPSGMFGL